MNKHLVKLTNSILNGAYALVLTLLIFGLALPVFGQSGSQTDVLKLGKPSSGQDKVIEFNTGAGAANPKIRANLTNSKLEFAQDGATFKAFGSGSGGGGGVELQENGGAEDGAVGWTVGGGGPAYSVTSTTTTDPNVGVGLKSFTWDPSAAAQTLTSTAYTIPGFGNSGTAMCAASFIYKGADANYTVSVVDGSANVLASTTLVARTGWNSPDAPTTIGFTCPATGSTVALKLTTSADPATIYFDEFKIGSLPTVNISQAKLVGQVKVTGCAANWTNTSTTLAAFAAQTGCVYSTVGQALAPTTNIPGIRFSKLQAGFYVLKAEGRIGQGTFGTTGGWASFQFTDGTTAASELSTFESRTSGDNNSAMGSGIEQTINYGSDKENVTLQIYSRLPGSASNIATIHNSTTDPLVISVYYYPLSTEAAVRVGSEAWKVDANIGGANIDLGAVDVASYTEAVNGSLTLTNNSGIGSISANITCAAGTAATGTTCSAVNESIGISFNVPRAGDARVCVDFTHYSLLSTTSGGELYSAFQLVETNTAGAILQEGKSRPMVSNTYDGAPMAGKQGKALHFCGDFTFTSVGVKNIKLMYEQDVVSVTVGTNQILADGAANIGQRDIRFTAWPTSQVGPQMVIPNGVSTRNTNGLIIAAADIASDGTVSNESEDWINGNCTVGVNGLKTCALVTSYFSSLLSCSVDSTNVSQPEIALTTKSTSQIIYTSLNSAGTGTSGPATALCIGFK